MNLCVASGEECAAGPSQLSSVKSDLIAFSPGREAAEPPAAAAPAEPSLPPPPAAAAPPAAAPEANVVELLKKQELHFTQEVRREGKGLP